MINRWVHVLRYSNHHVVMGGIELWHLSHVSDENINIDGRLALDSGGYRIK